MAKKKRLFRVKPFTNPSGKTVYRVSGTLRGKQIRRNFMTRTAAVAEVERLEVEAMDAAAELKPRLTRLSEAELHAAEILFDRAGGDVDAVLGLLPLLRAVERKRLAQAGIAWVSELERSGCREVTVQVMGYLFGAFAKVSCAEFVDEVSLAEVEGFVFGSKNRTTQRDRRQRVGQFLRFCVKRGWCVRNFAEDVPAIKVERDLPVIFSAKQMGDLLESARSVEWGGKNPARTLEPLVLLEGFTGLRPAEAKKVMRREWHLDADTSCIEVGPRVAKVRQCRQVELLENCRLRIADLAIGMKSTERVYFSSKHWKRVRENAGLYEVWVNDVLRHTYASWHYALFKDIKRLTYSMGNSEAVLFQNYIRPMTKREAGRYLALVS